MNNLKNIFLSALVAALVASVAVILFQKPQDVYVQNAPAGSVTKDTRLGQANTYTTGVATTTFSRALSERFNRCGLEIQNDDATSSLRVFLSATSTGFTSSTGILIDPKGTYTPEYNWPLDVWVVRDEFAATGTSYVMQETTCK